MTEPGTVLRRPRIGAGRGKEPAVAAGPVSGIVEVEAEFVEEEECEGGWVGAWEPGMGVSVWAGLVVVDDDAVVLLEAVFLVVSLPPSPVC